MKKMIFLFSLILLMSCSKDDDSSTSQINPPDWIIGTWLIDDPYMTLGWRFTSNDLIIIQNGIELSQKGQLESIINSGEEASAINTTTNDTYSLKLNLPAGQSVIYSFTRISDSEISWDTVTNSIYVKQ